MATIEPIVTLPKVKADSAIWYLQTGADNTLPVLYRSGSTGTLPGSQQQNSLGVSKVYSGITATDTIDVVNQFDWTVSSPESRKDVPVINIIEKRLLMNSNISNIANSVFSILNTGQSVSNTVLNALGPTLTNFLNQNNPAPLPAYLSRAGQSQQNQATSFSSVYPNSPLVKNSIANQYSNIQKGNISGVPTTSNSISLDTINSFLTNQGFNSFKSPVLKPYDFLYATEPTGFVYNFPYLENNNSTVSNNFGENESNFASWAQGAVRTLAESAASLTNFLKPGTYIEKAKQFSMGDTGRTINVKIPLLNTMSKDSINQNWQLLFGLIYQNRPGRITRSIIDMPVIYELIIPGTVYMPYAFISNLTVNFLGARRLMQLNVPVQAAGTTNRFTTINTIVPDAYELNISFTGMNEETRNFLYYSVFPQNVTVGTTA